MACIPSPAAYQHVIENRRFDEERALYGSHGLLVRSCTFAGPADGESALKECADIRVENSLFDLRYPLWHTDHLELDGVELTADCRAALWYARHVDLANTKLHGIKALRECSDVALADCDIVSSEFGWSCQNIALRSCTAQGEYFMMRSRRASLDDVRFRGKYSFQYLDGAVIENCHFHTKDAFWRSRNVTVRNSVIKGEYLGWYSDHLTLDHRRIVGTQPLCYCTNLTLVDCLMEECDLCFERSEVEATLVGPVDSVKNPLRGRIAAPRIGELVVDIPETAEALRRKTCTVVVDGAEVVPE